MDAERQMVINGLLLESSKSLLSKDKDEHPLMKSSEKSIKLRNDGNELYKKVGTNPLDREEVYKAYSQSIAFAKPNSEELALAYGNRSALLHRIEKYKESILDIDRALEINKSDSYKIKLLCRKIECLAYQGLPECNDVCAQTEVFVKNIECLDDKTKQNLNKTMSLAKKLLKNVETSKRQEKDEVPEHMKILLQKESANPFDSISIRHNEKYGRYLTTKRDFGAGEIIYVENSSIKVMNHINFYIYCGHCLATSWSTVPCDYCHWCMFCSEKCKNEAWEKYHDIECIIIAHLLEQRQVIRQIHYLMLTVRLLIIGAREASGINNLKSELKAVDSCTDLSIKGFKKNGMFRHLGLPTVYTLNGDVSAERLPIYTMNSVLILILLVKYTSFFEDISKINNMEELLKKKQVIFIGSLILKLHKISDKNCQQLPGDDPHTCKYSKDNYSCHTSHCCNRGFCITTINSLINHSCNPSVKNVVTTKQKFIVYSIEPIKKNCQIFISYQEPYFTMQKPMRQKILKEGFNFICDCPPCKKNWPTITELYNLLQKKPREFLSTVGPKEVSLMDIEADLVRSVVEDYDNLKCDQETVRKLSSALAKTTSCINNSPSVVLYKLKTAIQGVFEKLYEKA